VLDFYDSEKCDEHCKHWSLECGHLVRCALGKHPNVAVCLVKEPTDEAKGFGERCDFVERGGHPIRCCLENGHDGEHMLEKEEMRVALTEDYREALCHKVNEIIETGLDLEEKS